MFKKMLGVVITLITLTSCVSGSLVFVNEPSQSKYEEIFNGKTIGVKPFDVEFSARRFAIDLRGLKMSVNGNAIVLQKKFLTKSEIPKFGRIGVIDVNILEKTGANPGLIQSEVNKEWISGLLGETNYKVGFFNGLGEGNSGYLTNTPMERVSHFEERFLPATESTTYFSEVRDLTNNSADGLDYILQGYIDISNEVVELLAVEVNDYQPNIIVDADEPQRGQYYLLFEAYIEWEIVDAKTGEVVVDYREESENFIDTRTSKRVLLPIQNGDDRAFSDFFRSNDITPYALEEVISMMPRSYQFMAPFYKVTSKFIKDEE